QLSESIDADLFAWSHLIQPDLFLRARPGKVESVKDKLTKAGMPFLQSGNAFRLSNASKADTVLETDREAVIQDLNSQRTAAFLQIKEFLPLASRSYLSRVWDCCAASGGKSILAID